MMVVRLAWSVALLKRVDESHKVLQLARGMVD